MNFSIASVEFWVMAAFVLAIIVVLASVCVFCVSLRRDVIELRETLTGSELTPRLKHALFQFFASPHERRVLVRELKLALQSAEDKEKRDPQ